MTSFNPQIDFDGPLSKPSALIEPERYCRRCKDCWPLTSEFWGKDCRKADGFMTLCKACQRDQERKIVCPLTPDVASKACSTCHKIKPLTSACFMPMDKCKDGFSGQCRDCKNKRVAERKAAIKAGVELMKPFVPTKKTKYQVCNACKIEKPRVARFWHRNKGTHDGLLNQCKDCTNGVSKLRRVYPGLSVVLVKPEDKVYMKPKTPPPKRRHTDVFDAKSCNACKITKPLTTEFWYKSNSPSHSDGWVTRCKVCESNAQKEARRRRREAKALQESAA